MFAGVQQRKSQSTVERRGDKARARVPRQKPEIRSLIAAGRTLQAELKAGAPDDRYERQADRVAAQVVDGDLVTEAIDSVVPSSDVARPAQRVCEECEEELQRKPLGSGNGDHRGAIEHGALPSGGGVPLTPTLRRYFEPRFRHRFDRVRIHTGSAAAASAAALNAKAYTLADNIVFNQGYYRPESAQGRRLLAHELVHVVQQRGLGTAAARAPLQRSCFDGNCEDCAGGWHDLWVTVFFARRANRATMSKLRTEINEAKRVMEQCCLRVKFDFNWTLIPNASTIETASRHRRAAGAAEGLFDVPDPMERIGESDLLSRARGIPMLVVDEVQGTGGGTTILGGVDDAGRQFDVEYTGPSMFFVAVNQPRENSNCSVIAHEIWHIAGALRHDAAEGEITACTSNNVSETYCRAVRGLA
ncbi:MAG: DUF4157 domain-containing protein [Gammaproteobacteria bacterium]|nr:DUF4157 domain-containing protein [Gammaproteobacteria bacterium]